MNNIKRFWEYLEKDNVYIEKQTRYNNAKALYTEKFDIINAHKWKKRKVVKYKNRENLAIFCISFFNITNNNKITKILTTERI